MCVGGSRPLVAPHQGTSRYRATAGGAVKRANRTTLELESITRREGGPATRANPADQPFAAIFASASGANNCFHGSARIAFGEPPAGGDGVVLRVARIQRLRRGVRTRRCHGGPAGISREHGRSHLPI